MSWTKELPAVEGWYWYRSPRMVGATIVRVFRYKTPTPQPWLMNFAGDNSDLALPERGQAEWHGPIPEPK